MKEVKAYETEDGKVFKSLCEATSHQAKKDLENFLEREGVGSGGYWDTVMFENWLLDNRAELVILLDKIED